MLVQVPRVMRIRYDQYSGSDGLHAATLRKYVLDPTVASGAELR
jgi:hypothetical protein